MHITFLRTTIHNNKTAIYNIYNMREREREREREMLNMDISISNCWTRVLEYFIEIASHFDFDTGRFGCTL